ncbi:hypothetical protein SBA6_440004 [Candidatus Sulfopaludibacter sp. SbA6]|nr:hypothetical protein SBA6_440004 [Candidatus Sulfopaludibacter sp. SbA6]
MKTSLSPKKRKEPIRDAAHVRNAIAGSKQVQGVTDSERDAAWTHPIGCEETQVNRSDRSTARFRELKTQPAATGGAAPKD